MKDFLDQEYYFNSIREYLIVAGIILLSVVFLKLFKRYIVKRLRLWALKTDSTIDDFVVDGIEKFGLPIVQFAIVYWSLSFLDFTDRVARIIDLSATIIFTYYILRLFSTVILMLLQARIRRQEGGEEKIKQLGGVMIVINVIIWALGIIYVLDNEGKDVTAIIAGLGIGGIAIALAAQNILGDLFNYFVIFFDRPFEVGDFIIVDDKLGVVEYLGIKTTRIRSLSGEQLIIGNSNLTSARIHNYKRMFRRRIVFSIDVEYGTPLEKLKIIPGLLRSIVEENGDKIFFDRSHFAAYKDWSLRYEVVYFVLSPNYNEYMDIQQAINFRIYEEFEKHKVSFAFPTQMTLVKNEGNTNDGESLYGSKPRE